MKLKTLYVFLCVLGAALPYWQFVPWVVAHHGVPMSLFFRELFANRISAFFGMDVIVSAVVLVVFIRVEGKRLGIRRRWLPVLALLLVGVSLALPMFLYMREVQSEQGASQAATRGRLDSVDAIRF
jgi:AcrR family transcriptional regulator